MWSKIIKPFERKATNCEQSLIWKSLDIRHNLKNESLGYLMLHVFVLTQIFQPLSLGHLAKNISSVAISLCCITQISLLQINPYALINP